MAMILGSSAASKRAVASRPLATSQAPGNQSSLSARRVILDTVNGLSGKAGLLRDLSNAHCLLPEHGAHLDELLASEARLAAVGAAIILLCVLDQRVLGLPIDPFMRQFGRGGAAPGYEPKLQIVQELRDQYFRDHRLISQTVFEDINAVPLDYLNAALAARNESWRVRIVDGDEYEFFIPK